jgi:hypothetical protein
VRPRLTLLTSCFIFSLGPDEERGLSTGRIVSDGSEMIISGVGLGFIVAWDKPVAVEGRRLFDEGREFVLHVCGSPSMLR